VTKAYCARVRTGRDRRPRRPLDRDSSRPTAVGAQVPVLSGDVRAVQLLSERLPNDHGLLVHHITGSRAADGSQATRPRRVEQALRETAKA
jgi:Bacterial archaeo-eukaryotic release factor family 2